MSRSDNAKILGGVAAYRLRLTYRGLRMGRRKTQGNKFATAYDRLKELVAGNRFVPGEQLRINKLANELAVSQTPIREALILLASENLVTAHANHGYFIKVPEAAELEENYQLVFLVFRHSLELALGGPDGLQFKAAVLSALAEPKIDRPGDCFVFAIEELYREIVLLSCNSAMLKIVSTFRARTHALRLAAVRHPGYAAQLSKHLAELVQRFRNNDARAVDCMHDYLELKISWLPRLIAEATAVSEEVATCGRNDHKTRLASLRPAHEGVLEKSPAPASPWKPYAHSRRGINRPVLAHRQPRITSTS